MDKFCDIVKILDVYDLWDLFENRIMFFCFLLKFMLINSGSVNWWIFGDFYFLIEVEVDDFVWVEFCEDGVILIYNFCEVFNFVG